MTTRPPLTNAQSVAILAAGLAAVKDNTNPAAAYAAAIVVASIANTSEPIQTDEALIPLQGVLNALGAHPFALVEAEKIVIAALQARAGMIHGRGS